ncbi:Cytochrome oxidase biogenesis protein Sco1/SenC/PrrC, putative copper metallochaperone [Indibacter alkaliphilus LW1]|uniref:Cytochrome oxidase biogenesis protein Sco1/SenC/PrrC, putative copper metallochaperone n=1 Tax=Indibacter alkaliphilus (strain CCUG 57479 / KCTC 22604 / LW1) TaxID=1189612 RepID=S2D2Z6_INDAL|nr:SCO family protein [Indibacter alkaliphilus]EOZ93249.1 Cytochrome oxidase biogenesis protein Sco1/SenC/PrrC, putative copper metallochaperone [Indibacter alkaliphilus LW1]
MNKYTAYFLILSAAFIWACDPGSKEKAEEANKPLPILGNSHINEFEMEGKVVKDTIYHKIADFSFTNQEGKEISNNTTDGKVYVADFFFTTCPTICPIMKTQMLRIYEKFQDESDFMILSHTLDPEHDTQELLKDYAAKIGVEDDATWQFLTGDQERIFEIGQTSYLTTAMSDKDEPGGILHSGAFVLVDQKGRIRGVYDGTKEDQVNRLMRDIPKLLPNNE